MQDVTGSGDCSPEMGENSRLAWTKGSKPRTKFLSVSHPYDPWHQPHPMTSFCYSHWTAAVLEGMETERNRERTLSQHSQPRHDFHSDWTGLNHMTAPEPVALIRRKRLIGIRQSRPTLGVRLACGVDHARHGEKKTQVKTMMMWGKWVLKLW